MLCHKLYLKNPDVTFPNQGKIHPEWKRCLQGISRTVSCSSNSSKHTGHLRPLSVQHTTENWRIVSWNIWTLNIYLEMKSGSFVLSLAVTCLLWRNDHHTELLNCSFCGWRRKALVPVGQVKGPRVHEVQALHQRPADAERCMTQPEQSGHLAHGFCSPGQFQECVLPILFIRVGGLTVVFIKIRSHLFKNSLASSLHQQFCTPLDKNRQSCVNVKHTGDK